MNETLTSRGQRVELKFGTSGLRGLVRHMTDREVYVNTLGFSRYLLETSQIEPGDIVAVGRDLRHVDPSTGISSSPRITAAVCLAISDAGLVARNCGILPTPALAAYALHGATKSMASIMITGSHIPADRNGIKFYKPAGELMKRDEPAVLAAVALVRRELERSHLFRADDQLREPATLPEETADASRHYLTRYAVAFEGARPLEGKIVALFEHSAAGRDLLAELLSGLGAQVLRLGRTNEFVSVDTEDVSLADEERYRGMLENSGAFALVSTDGDSDRPLIVDERGRFHRGDIVGLVTAEALGARFAAVPVSATDAIERRLEALAEQGQTMELCRTRIGSPYVIEAMEEALQRGLEPVVGWESNGGFLTSSSVTLGGAKLWPLPTRDAALPIIAVLTRAAIEGCAVSELFDALPPRATRAGLLDDFSMETSRRILALLAPQDTNVSQVNFKEDATVSAQARACRRQVERIFSSRYGFSNVASMNFVDGVRIGFDQGDVVHIRPSGNAPQLRLYAIADTQERADRIVELGIRPNGLLRQLEALVDDSHLHGETSATETNPLLAGLLELRKVVRDNQGPRQVLAIVNGGDAEAVERELSSVAAEIFRADGQVRIAAHEEKTRRGQFLGLLDAVRAFEDRGRLEPGVALGIMLPGKGTRLSPFTQRLHGIKPFFPTPIMARLGGGLLSGAAASLYTWTLVAHHLERMGFDGIAWKWGDEPQLPASRLGALDWDLSSVDAVRFGSKVPITEDLARHKEWLRADEEGNLLSQLRRRPRVELCQAMGLDPADPNAVAHVHLGSPAFSRVFLEEAAAVFGQWDGWLDVDGYLFEALTCDQEAWDQEVERDPGLQALIDQRPGFYEAVRQLEQRIESRRGHKMQIKVIDFGQGLYWADLGQLSRAAEVFGQLREPTPLGAYARELIGMGQTQPDEHGNYVLGACDLPVDGSVRDCIVVSSVLGPKLIAQGAVIVESSILSGHIEPGSVALRTYARSLKLESGSFSFASVSENLELASHWVHTSIPVDSEAQELTLESYMADMNVDTGSGAAYHEPAFGNRLAFSELFDRMRRRQTSPEEIERRIAQMEAALARDSFCLR